MSKKVICTRCDKKVENAEISGMKMIKNKLMHYYLCKVCVRAMPNANFHNTKKANNERQSFWDNIEAKMAVVAAE